MMSGTEEKQYGDVLPYWEELEFLINVHDGVTKRLVDRAKKSKKVKVWIDGPYGFSPNLKNDDTVVVVAGAPPRYTRFSPSAKLIVLIGGSGVSLAISTFLGVVR